MKLFLASTAKHPDSLKALEKFVRGFSGKKIAYIPTADNGEEGYGAWKTGNAWKVIQKLDADISLVVLEEYRSNKVIDVLKDNDIIWFGGGFWGYLMYWVRLCEIDVHIKELLDAGKIYVGSSAGTNIASKSIELAEWFRYDLEEWGIEKGAGIFPGLGLVDFDIYPHYSEELHDYVKEKYKGDKMYLLKDGEQVIVDGDKIEVIGKERIIGKSKS